MNSVNTVSSCWRFLTVLLACCGGMSVATAQDAETASGRVFGTIWHANVQMQDGFSYLNQVREELGLQQPGLMMFSGAGLPGLSRLRGANRIGVSSTFGGARINQIGSAGQAQPEVDDPEVRGTLLFLQLQPEISLNQTIAFESCDSLEEFESRVRLQVQQFGPAAELIGSEERYEVKLNFGKLMSSPPPPPADSSDQPDGEPKQVVRMSIVMSATAGGPGPAAGAAPQMPQSISTWYRYQDGMLFSSQTAALHTIELPSPETLRPDEDNAAEDIAAELDFTKIPVDLKQTFWTELERQASVFLQQWDNEAPGEYSLRRVIAQGRLELLRRVMFDLERAGFRLSFAKGTETPIVSQLRLTARKNSALAGFLAAVSNRGTQLTALQDEDSPLVISSTLAIPESLKPFLGAFIASMSVRANEYAAEIPAAEVLVNELSESLQQSVATGFVDAAICLRGSVESGLIPCGGIRLESAETFVSSMELLLQVLDSERSLLISRSGLENDIVSLRTSPIGIPAARQPVPLQLNLTGRGNWLWFTVGEQAAVDMLESLVSESEESLDVTGRGTPLLVRMKVDRWLGASEDPLSSVPAALIKAVEGMIQQRSRPKMMVSINGQNVELQTSDDDDEAAGLAEKCLLAGQSDVEFRVRSSNQELIFDLTSGVGLPRLAAGKYLQSQSRMFQNFRFDGGSLKFPASGGVSGPIQMRIGGSGPIQIRIGGPEQN